MAGYGFYNEKRIGTKARKNKTCAWCGKTIERGVPHYELVDMESYCRYPIHDECHTIADKECDGDMEEFLKHDLY